VTRPAAIIRSIIGSTPRLIRPPKAHQFLGFLFAFEIFAASLLLFQVEPLIGKFILPWFGGGPSVWTSCMLFFQLMLLLGYAYAHLSLHRLTPPHQVLIHVVILMAAASLLPIAPPADWKPDDSIHPTLLILFVLLGSVGLPYFVLAANGPLMQAWFIRLFPGKSPYPLYALSNLGSLLALMSYPFAIEPFFSLRQQALGWATGFMIMVLSAFWLALAFRKRALKRDIAGPSRTKKSEQPSLSEHLPKPMLWILWLLLPAASSTLLLATTNQLCQDVTSVPFLWLLPLTLFLLTYILCFAQHSAYSRTLFNPLLILSLFGMVTLLYAGSTMDLLVQVIIYSVGLFCCCMSCHGELYRLRPQPAQLTTYYLLTAGGGALGGLFVAIIAPLIFSLYFEFHIALLASGALPLIAMAQDKKAFNSMPHPTLIRAACLLGLLILAGRLYYHSEQVGVGKRVVTRNFYGVLRVEDRLRDDPDMNRRILRHGAIDHGFQFLSPQKRDWPTAYYGPDSGVALALTKLTSQGPRHIGLVGLGIGTLLHYGRPTDTFRIYEIDPTVVALAEDQFSFIQDTTAKKNIIVADARLQLEREPSQQFDLLILDAFCGDAIPLHLLTIEAIKIYRRHLKPDGILAINISNHHLDLAPVIQGLTLNQQLHSQIIHSRASLDGITHYAADWALLMAQSTLKGFTALDNETLDLIQPNREVLWTDDFSNLYRVLK